MLPVQVKVQVTFESILDDLRRRYGNTSFYPIEVFAQELGLADQTARNMIAVGRFPVPTRKIGGKRLVLVHDLANFIFDENCFKPKPKEEGRAEEGRADQSGQGQVPTGRKRGRPTKAKAEAAAAAGQ